MLFNFEQRAGNTKWQKIEEIREALEAKGKITDDEFQSLRFLVKEVIGYRDFSNQLRNELVSYISLQTYSQGELIIGPDVSKPANAFIVASGYVKLSMFPPDILDCSDNLFQL